MYTLQDKDKEKVLRLR